MKYDYAKIIILYGVSQKVISVKFWPKSEAYKKYGPYLVGQVRYEELELEKILKNEYIHKNSFVKFDVSFPEDIKELFHKELVESGFAIDSIYLIDAYG